MSEYTDYGYLDETPCHAWEYMMPPLLSLLDKKVNTCILDLGCGNGYLVNHLIEMGYNAYGTDASEQGIAIAQQTNPDRFFVQDLSSGKIPAGLDHLVFDTVVSTEVIEHLYNPQIFIELCKQTLSKSKGEIIISTPYHGYIKNLILGIFNKWDQHLDPMWQGGHIKFWSRATVTKILEKNEFAVTGFKGAGRIPYFWKSMFIKGKLL